MYYLSKLFQAAGLVIIGFSFIQKFPELMNPRVLLMGIVIFGVGWLIQKFLLK